MFEYRGPVTATFGALTASALSLVLQTGCSRGSDIGAPAGLAGAWRIVETTTRTPDSSWVDDSPQPGLYIFTGRHFSIMLIPQDSPRAHLREDASPEERLAAYENFIADAGSYEASDSSLTMRNFIAKWPNAMNGGAGGPYRYQLSVDSLTLSFKGAWAVDAGGEITYRLVRLK